MVHLTSNGKTQTKLVILAFLYCGQFVKILNNNESRVLSLNMYGLIRGQVTDLSAGRNRGGRHRDKRFCTIAHSATGRCPHGSLLIVKLQKIASSLLVISGIRVFIISKWSLFSGGSRICVGGSANPRVGALEYNFSYIFPKTAWNRKKFVAMGVGALEYNFIKFFPKTVWNREKIGRYGGGGRALQILHCH